MSVVERPVLLTVPEVARLLRLSTRRVYKLARDGTLPSVRFGEGGSVRIAPEALERFIANGGAAAP